MKSSSAAMEQLHIFATRKRWRYEWRAIPGPKRQPGSMMCLKTRRSREVNCIDFFNTTCGIIQYSEDSFRYAKARTDFRGRWTKPSMNMACRRSKSGKYNHDRPIGICQWRAGHRFWLIFPFRLSEELIIIKVRSNIMVKKSPKSLAGPQLSKSTSTWHI